MSLKVTAQDVLDFWFNETSAEQRFSKDAALDQKIHQRFSETFHQVLNGETANWRRFPEGRLAEILVLDQFARNMFRNTPQAFAGDALALELAQEAVNLGDDMKLPLEQRSFLYMPFMHSENAAIHKKAIELFSQKGLEYNLKFEFMHQQIIERFGRYPHRNQILGRHSTTEEIEYLKKQPNPF